MRRMAKMQTLQCSDYDLEVCGPEDNDWQHLSHVQHLVLVDRIGCKHSMVYLNAQSTFLSFSHSRFQTQKE